MLILDRLHLTLNLAISMTTVLIRPGLYFKVTPLVVAGQMRFASNATQHDDLRA